MQNETRFAEFKYVDTYYLCSCIRSIVLSRFGYLRFFDDLWSEGRVLGFVDGFRKKESGLELFISSCLWEIYGELTRAITPAEIESASAFGRAPKLQIEVLFDAYGVKYGSYADYCGNNEPDPAEYFDSMSDELAVLTEKLSKEVLNVLFFDRAFLQKYYELLAGHLEDFVKNDGAGLVDSKHVEELFTKRMRLKRKDTPKWLRRAVFYREHGCCALCQRDLGGVLTNLKSENFDHIVPLDRFGCNDVGNVQLLCAPCNSRKRALSTATSDVYVSLW